MSKSIHDTNFSNNQVHKAIENFKLWFVFLLKKWWIIAIVGFLGGLLGFWNAYSERPKYQSHLTFALDDGEGGMGGAFSLAAEFGLSVGKPSNIFEGDNILALMTSRRIIERVLLSVDTLSGTPITIADYYKKITTDTTKKVKESKSTSADMRLSNVSFPVGQPKNTFTYLQDSVLLNICKGFAKGESLKVGKPDKKLNMYEVSVTSFDERFSKVFTDHLIQEVTSFYTELKTKKSKETLEVLETRLAETKGALNTAIVTKAGIQDANINPVFQQAQAQLQQKQVDISSYGGAYGELYKNLEMARYEYLKNIPLLQIIDAADYPMTKIKKGKFGTALNFSVLFAAIVVVVLTLIHVVKSELYSTKSVVEV